jgi:hypothetical protein
MLRRCLCLVAVLFTVSLAAQAETCDVAVYGGVPCGVAAAIAAAREGADVILIEPTRHVGGLNTSGICTAETEHMLEWTFGGIALEFYTRLGQRYGNDKPAYYFESKTAEALFLEMLAEAKVKVRYGQRVEKAEKSGAHIDRIVLTDGTPITAKVFIDAGYEGDLMSRAGVKYTWGREARSEFNEDAAGIRFDTKPRDAATVDEAGKLLPSISGWAKDYPEQGAADRTVMNYNWRLLFSNDPAQSVPIPAPEHYDRARYRLLENWFHEKAAQKQPVKLTDIIDLYKHCPNRPDKREANNRQDAVISLGHFGGQVDYPDADYATRDRIVADHTDYTRGLLHFLANDESVPENVRHEMKSWGLAKDEFPDNGHWPYQLYVREARRMRGAYVMTQHDVQEERHKPDAIAMGSHFIDCHHVQRLALSPTQFINEGRIWRLGQAYQIPYRALTPKAAECENLLVAGAASYTHVAFCTYRLESTWMMGGHAAGVAAAQAARAGQAVQKIDVSALQDQLRAEGQLIDFVPGEPEKFQGKAGYQEF